MRLYSTKLGWLVKGIDIIDFAVGWNCLKLVHEVFISIVHNILVWSKSKAEWENWIWVFVSV
jgi:hypothetical protein